jgi:hypothetical protein
VGFGEVVGLGDVRVAVGVARLVTGLVVVRWDGRAVVGVAAGRWVAALGDVGAVTGGLSRALEVADGIPERAADGSDDGEAGCEEGVAEAAGSRLVCAVGWAAAALVVADRARATTPVASTAPAAEPALRASTSRTARSRRRPEGWGKSVDLPGKLPMSSARRCGR